MQMRELISVLEEIDGSLKDNNIVSLYKKLITSLNQARKKPSPEVSAKVVQHRELIRAAHDTLASDGQLPFNPALYEKLGAGNLIGNGAMDRIDEIFQIYEADPSSMAEAMGELLDQTNELVQKVRELRDGLRPLVEDRPLPAPDEGILQILFPGETTARTIEEMEESLEQWGRVINAFSRLTRQPDHDATIVNIEQNPLILELAVRDEVINSIANATCEVLSVYEKYLDIRRVGLEVNYLELRNRGIADQLEKEAEMLIRNTASDVTKSLMEEFDWKKESERSDVHNHVSNAVAIIFDFVKNNGKIEVYERSRADSISKKQLTDSFTQVNQLEQQITRLNMSGSREETTIGVSGAAE